MEIVGCGEKNSDEKQLQEVTEHSIEDLKNSWDEPREEKAVLIQQQPLQHMPRRRDGDTSTSTSKTAEEFIPETVERFVSFNF